MIVAIAIVSGVTLVYVLTFLFVLMWCTQCFGHFTEELSRPEPVTNNRAPREWYLHDNRIDTKVLEVVWASLHRLAPHLLGYVPYATIWAVLFHSFVRNSTRTSQRPPSFVYVIVIGQFVVFSLFGVVQLVNQARADGPAWYWKGELVYLVLSIVAKGLLGLTLLTSVLLYDTFDEAVANAS